MQLKDEDKKALNELGNRSIITHNGVNFNLHKFGNNFLLSISYNDLDKSSQVRKFRISSDGEILNFSEYIIPYGESELIHNYNIDDNLAEYCSNVIKSFSKAVNSVEHKNDLFKTTAELGLNKMPGSSPADIKYKTAHAAQGKEL